MSGYRAQNLRPSGSHSADLDVKLNIGDLSVRQYIEIVGESGAATGTLIVYFANPTDGQLDVGLGPFWQAASTFSGIGSNQRYAFGFNETYAGTGFIEEHADPLPNHCWVRLDHTDGTPFGYSAWLIEC